MLKGYYINEATIGPDGESNAPGVENKICQQLKAFKTHYEMERLQIKQKKRCYLLKRLPGYKKTYNLFDTFDKIKYPDFIYIRKCRLERGWELFLKKLKSDYPSCKILFEFPTYPYDSEFFNIKGGRISGYPFYLLDKYYRERMHKYVDRIVIYGDTNEILGIKTINTINGITVNDFRLKSWDKESDTIVLLAVANFQSGHGYERIIKGLYDYYNKGGNRSIKLLMVGEGIEKHEYEILVNKYGLSDRVLFTGKKSGNELNEIYDQAHIGLGCFGLYKLGFEHSSALKIREYLSRGLPVMSGCDEDALRGSVSDFFLQYPNDKSTVDIKRMIDFYDEIQDKEKLSVRIRQYACETVDMAKTLQPIFEYIDS